MTKYLSILILSIPLCAQDSQFWTNKQIVLQSMNAAIRTYDMVQTCRLPGPERWIPAQSCPATTAWIASGIPVSILSAYLAHHHHHNRIAAAIPVLFFGSDAAAVAETEYNFHGWKPERRKK